VKFYHLPLEEAVTVAVVSAEDSFEGFLVRRAGILSDDDCYGSLTDRKQVTRPRVKFWQVSLDLRTHQSVRVLR